MRVVCEAFPILSHGGLPTILYSIPATDLCLHYHIRRGYHTIIPGMRFYRKYMCLTRVFAFVSSACIVVQSRHVAGCLREEVLPVDGVSAILHAPQEVTVHDGKTKRQQKCNRFFLIINRALLIELASLDYIRSSLCQVFRSTQQLVQQKIRCSHSIVRTLSKEFKKGQKIVATTVASIGSTVTEVYIVSWCEWFRVGRGLQYGTGAIGTISTKFLEKMIA